jgi:hypothetical protein
MRRPVVAILAAVAVVFGLVVLGHYARDWLDRRHHYSIKIADLNCETPPGMDKAKFLAEVQYCGSFPDEINVLDAGLVNRLQAAFALHPWVERVDGISFRGPEGPTVRLVIRRPALAVGERVVDRFGVLLPAGTPTAGLPAYGGEAPPPKGRAGTPWGDAKVEAAARAAGGS